MMTRAKRRKEDVDGFAITRQLEALLPRRPTKKVVDGPVTNTRKKTSSRQAATKAKPASKSEITKKLRSSKGASSNWSQMDVQDQKKCKKRNYEV